MQKQRFYISALALGCFSILSSLTAQSAQAGEIEWNGFGSAYYGQAFNPELRPSELKTTSADFTSLSSFGLNVASQMDPMIRVAAQFVAKSADVNGDWDLDAKWAFVSLSPIEHFTIKLGRQLEPIFIASEYSSVGYLLPYRSIPAAVMMMAPIESFNGVSGNYKFDLGEAESLTFSVFGGTPKYSVPSSVSGGAKDLLGLTLTFDGDGYRGRLQYSRARVNLTFGPTFAPLNNTYACTADAYSGGLRYDKHDFVVWSEMVQSFCTDGPDIPYLTTGIGGSKFLESLKGGYALLGYRVGKFLPRYMYSWANQNSGLTVGHNTTHNVGLNYSLSTQALLKIEYQIDLAPPATESGAGVLDRDRGSMATYATSAFAGLDFIF